MSRWRFFLCRIPTLLVMWALVGSAVMVPRPAGAVPAAPVLISPPDDPYGMNPTTAINYPPNGTPTFVWQAVSGATKYGVEICTTSSCATYVDRVETVATRWTPQKTLPDGPLYWRVRASDAGGWGPYSAVWSFTKSWMTGVTWSLQRPYADEVVEFFEYPIFSWDPVIGAAFYRLQIFAAPCTGNTSLSKDVLKTTYTPTERLPRGEYYWWVIPFDGADPAHAGMPSECRHFTMDYQQRPTLLAPEDGSILSLTPEFRWTAVKGAKAYRFQYSTTPDFSTYTEVTTRNTRYTPSEALANDTDYYWRVAAVDTRDALGPWSPAPGDPNQRDFRMSWHLTPRLLSPTDNFLWSAFPVFRWTPVAGAKSYDIQVDDEPSFGAPLKFEAFPVDPRYDHLGWGNICPTGNVPCVWYWRVRAKDASDHWGPWTDPPGAVWFGWRYDTGLGTPAPTLVYPPYYYDPATEPSTQPLGVAYDPTVPVPVFQWDRVVHHLGANTEVMADEYVIEVDDDPGFGSVDWTTRTENLSIAPSLENGFVLPAGIYYWRVRAYRYGAPMQGGYSEAWPFRFDPGRQAYSSTISLYFPADGMDSVYDTPLFGWSPIQGAHHYDFQLATTDGFTDIVHFGQPLYSFYTPQERLSPDTYYWRVQAQDAAHNPLTPWSEARRVVITYPLFWADPTYLPLLDPINQQPGYTRIGQDFRSPPGGVAYDLTNLYFARDTTYWYMALDMPITNSVDMYFVFYVDLDHQPGSGGTTDPKGFSVYADSTFRPERVFYAHHNTAGAIDSVKFYRWTGSAWGVEEDLVGAGGAWSYHQAQYLQLKVPLNVLVSDLGTISVQAFSASSGGQAQDTVPAEPAIPTSYLTNPASVSDKLNPLHPWDNPFSNPFIYYENPMLSFAKPVPWSYVQGYRIEVAYDYAFTSYVPNANAEWFSASPTHYWFLGTRWTWTSTFPEAESLYWRVRVKHSNTAGWGPWSQPVRFVKKAFLPANLTVEYDYAPPTFRWDRVEGAKQYNLQLDDDPSFSSLNLDAYTRNPSYTPVGTLANKTWHWRMRVQDGSDRWSSLLVLGPSFTKYSRSPELVSPVGGQTVVGLPTFIWQNVLYPPFEPVMNSVKYNLQVDYDEVFQSPYLINAQNIDTLSYSPEGTNFKMLEGTYYWRVAALDADGNGDYSPPQSFVRTIPAPQSLYSSAHPFVDLAWTPVDGAARYIVQICADPYFTRQCESATTENTHYTSTRLWLDDVYWRVCMCDKAGACGPYYQAHIRWATVLPIVMKHKQLDKR